MNNLIFLAKASEFVDPVGDGMTWTDRWARFSGLGIQTFILGMLTVFAVLAILWGCLEVFKYVFYTIPERRKNGGAKVNKAEKPAPAPVSAPAPAAAPAANTEEEIVAAIIAAITAARAEEGIPASTAFRVVSFRKRK